MTHIPTHRKAITTKVLPCTNYRGARIKATDYDGNSITLDYPHEFSGVDCHYQAAKALCDKMQWQCDLISGNAWRFYVFVMVDAHNKKNFAEVIQ